MAHTQGLTPNFNSCICTPMQYCMNSVELMHCFYVLLHQFSLQCANYSQGLISGSFCPKLCSEGSVTYVKCLGHGVKPHVLLMKYRGSDIILKAKRSTTSSTVRYRIKSFKHLLKSKSAVDFKDFKSFIDRAMQGTMFGTKRYNVSDAVLEELARECDANKDKRISLVEAASCLRIIASEEYLYYVMLRGTAGMPEAYGTCGNSFAVESYSATDMENHIIGTDPRSWDKRAKIAIALIELVQAFENTPYGTVFLCDVKDGNFGVKTLPDGTIKAGAIDMDISFFESEMQQMVDTQAKWGQKKCSSDEDCDFISCWAKCNFETQRCDNKLYSSNIQVRLKMPLHHFHIAQTICS